MSQEEDQAYSKEIHQAEIEKRKIICSDIENTQQMLQIQNSIQINTQNYIATLENYTEQQKKLQEKLKRRQERQEKYDELLKIKQQEYQLKLQQRAEQELLKKEKENIKNDEENPPLDQPEGEQNQENKDLKQEEIESIKQSKIPSIVHSEDEDNQEDFISQEQLLQLSEELYTNVQEYQQFLEDKEEQVQKYLSHNFQYSSKNPPSLQEMKRFAKFINENYKEFVGAFKQQIQLQEQEILEEQEKLKQQQMLEQQKDKEISFKKDEEIQDQKLQLQIDNNSQLQQKEHFFITNKSLNLMFIKTGILNYKHVLEKQKKHFKEFIINQEDLISQPSQEIDQKSQNLTNSNLSLSSKASDFLEEKIQNQQLKEQFKLNEQIKQLKEKGQIIGEQSFCIHHNPQNKGKQNQNSTTYKLQLAKSKLLYYCQNCEELCCEHCVTTGPHNNRLHSIQQLQIFQEQQTNFLSKIIQTDLGKKREKIYSQQEKLQNTQNEIFKESNVIEKDIISQFEGIYSRLGDAEGSKVSILQKDITKYQRFVNDIEDFVTVFDRLTQDEDDQLRFLFMYKKIKNEEKRLQTIQVNTEINQYPYDLPRELSQLKILLKEVESNDEINKFRTKAIYELLEMKKQNLEIIKQEETDKFKKEFDYWIDLADRLNSDYLNRNLICFYCGDLMGLQSINGQCSRNKDYVSHPEFAGYTTVRPPKEFNGCKRHYFNEPILKYRTPQLGKLRKLPNNDQWQSEILYYNTIKTLAVTFRKLKRLLLEQQINLTEEFEKLEKPTEKGLVNVVKFEYVLNSILGLEEAETYRLTNFVIQKKPEKKDKNMLSQGYNSNINLYKKEEEVEEERKSDDLINYKIFIQLIEDQSSLEARAQKILNVDRLIRMQEEYFITIEKKTIPKEQRNENDSNSDEDDNQSESHVNDLNNRSKYEQYRKEKQKNKSKNNKYTSFGDSSRSKYGGATNSYINSRF